MAKPRTGTTKLARMRHERGVTQVALAEATGIDRRTIQRLEVGDFPNPKLGLLVRIAIALDASLEEIIEDEMLTWNGALDRTPRRPTSAVWEHEAGARARLSAGGK